MTEFYDEEYLLDRLYEKIGNNGIKGKIVMPKPVSGISNRKTYLDNYEEIRNKIERKYVPTLMQFIHSELSADVSLSGDNKLIIAGIFRNPTFEKIIKTYCMTYIQCQSCKGGNTDIVKEDKILFMKCNNCKSNKSI